MEVSAAQGERVRQLERELDSLRVRVEEKENTAVRAAELGQALLRENEALEERLNQVNKETTQRIEVRGINVDLNHNRFCVLCHNLGRFLRSVYLQYVNSTYTLIVSSHSVLLFFPPSL